jgi:hypothetical protein
MLSVTQAARVYLSDMLDQSGAPDGAAIRIVARDDGLKTLIDSSREGDAVVEHEGRCVLLLDSTVSERLSAHTLDVEPGADVLLLT